MKATSTTITLSLGRIRLRDEGLSSAETLCFVHGLSYPLEVWEPLVAPLREAGLRCLRYDLPGRGESTFRGAPLTPEALAEQALAVMDHQSVERAHIVTLSNGDLITLTLGAMAPERVRSLNLVAPSGWDARTMNMSTRWMCRTPGVSHLFGGALRRRLAKRMRAHQEHLPEGCGALARAAYEAGVSSVLQNPHFAAAAASQLGHMPTRATLIRLIEDVASQGIPTTLIHYDEEGDSTSEGVAIYRDQLPAAQHIVMPQGTHMGLCEYPEALAQALLTRLKALEGPLG